MVDGTPYRTAPTVAAALLGAAALGLVGCGGPPHPTLADLHEVPGSGLTYPGAHVTTRQETQSTHGADGDSPALILVEGCVAATAAQLLDWYGSQLSSDGWQPQQGNTGVSDPHEFASDHAWRRGDYRFDVLIGTPGHSRALASRAALGSSCEQAFRTTSQ